MIQNGDIVYVLSGGPDNADPTASLGGDPSALPILQGINNLFANVTPAAAAAGSVDYGCFYIFNNSLTDTLWNTNVYLTNASTTGSILEVGFYLANEIQTLTISGGVTGGSLTMSYEGNDFTFSYNSNIGTWASNLQTALQSLPCLSDVTVTVKSTVSESNVPITTFTIVYAGTGAGNRSQPLLDVVSNNLTPLPVVASFRVVSGSPINTIAPQIDQSTTPPTGIVFTITDQDNPVFLGDLQPADGLPVWLMRTTLPNSAPLADDAISLVCTGTAFPS